MAISAAVTAPTKPVLTLVAANPAPSAQARDLPAPKGITLVPGEDVLLLAVDLPLMPAAQRRAAVGFAIEDRIAQPLDDVQVTLGPQLSPGVWLVAVTSRAVLAAMPQDRARPSLLPDVLLVPVPLVGWAVWTGSDRALVRLADGTGFATRSEQLPMFWQMAGSPPVQIFGGALPATIAITSRADLPEAPEPGLAGFDLRGGRLGSGAQTFWPRGLRSLLAVLVVVALGHLALLGAEVIALDRLAGQREAELRSLLAAPPDANLDTTLAQALAARQPSGKDGLLDQLTRAFAAIAGQAGQVSVQDLQYTAANNSTVLTLEAPDLAALQAVETALTGAGLTVAAGAATTSDGGAEVQMTLTGGGA